MNLKKLITVFMAILLATSMLPVCAEDVTVSLVEEFPEKAVFSEVSCTSDAEQASEAILTPSANEQVPEAVETPAAEEQTPEAVEAPIIEEQAPEAVETPAEEEQESEAIETPAEEEQTPEAIETPAEEEPTPEAVETPAEEEPTPEAVETPAEEEQESEAIETPAEEEPTSEVGEEPAAEEQTSEAGEEPAMALLGIILKDEPFLDAPEGEEIEILKEGTFVAVWEIGEVWARIKYNRITGYVHSDCVSLSFDPALLETASDPSEEENASVPEEAIPEEIPAVEAPTDQAELSETDVPATEEEVSATEEPILAEEANNMEETPEAKENIPAADGTADTEVTNVTEDPSIAEENIPAADGADDTEVASAAEDPSIAEENAPATGETADTEEPGVVESTPESGESTPVAEDTPLADEMIIPEEISADTVPVDEDTSLAEEASPAVEAGTPVDEIAMAALPEEIFTEYPEGLSGILLTADTLYDAPGGEAIDGTELIGGMQVMILAVGQTWSKVEINGMTGYIPNDRLSLYNEPQPVDESLRSINLSSNTQSLGVLHVGDLISISAELKGFENDTYYLQWQYSPDQGVTALDIPGANDATYCYYLTRQNATYVYRLVVYIQVND